LTSSEVDEASETVLRPDLLNEPHCPEVPNETVAVTATGGPLDVVGMPFVTFWDSIDVLSAWRSS